MASVDDRPWQSYGTRLGRGSGPESLLSTPRGHLTASSASTSLRTGSAMTIPPSPNTDTTGNSDPPGVNTRIIRGTELHRRNGSLHLPATPLPPRAMMLDQVHPSDRTRTGRYWALFDLETPACLVMPGSGPPVGGSESPGASGHVSTRALVHSEWRTARSPAPGPHFLRY